jgi:hypothetical protein
LRTWILVVASLVLCSPAGQAEHKIRLRCLRCKPNLNEDAVYGFYETAWRPWPGCFEAAPAAAPLEGKPMPHATSVAPKAVPAPPAPKPEAAVSPAAKGEVPPLLPMAARR